MAQGKVKWFDSKKGYGFIKDNDTEKDIFLHVTSLEKSKLRVLKENQELEFEIKEEKGNVPKNVTNALFVGSTTELQKLIKKNKDKK